MMKYGTKIIMFGGRSNPFGVIHNPKTYDVDYQLGELNFITYDTKPTKACPAGKTEEECYGITIRDYHNDIWMYEMDCPRDQFFECRDENTTAGEWQVVEPGAIHGGCSIIAGIYECTHPNERYNHISAMFEDGTLFVYGGYSQWCEDYCDDMWMVNIETCILDPAACIWTPLGTTGANGPGKRWRTAFTQDSHHIYMYGGHRLWHGLARENSAQNLWNRTDEYPYGGYMDDLWIYTHNESNPTSAGTWTQVLPLESCYAAPGPEYEDRHDIMCTIHWPSTRASAALVLHQGQLWMHGGYTSHFPYPTIDGAGAGRGAARNVREITDGKPYPVHPYYLGDFWRFNLTSGLWYEVEVQGRGVPPSDLAAELEGATIDTSKNDPPSARRDHVLTRASNNTFLMFGGYQANYLLNDFWIFNLTSHRWLRKDEQAYPMYNTRTCTSDVTLLSDDTDYIHYRSVYGQPTRHTPVDGLYGRASEDVFINQPRRQAPGWDGCRERYDERADLPNLLQYEAPSQRWGAEAVWFDEFGKLVVYGGMHLVAEQVFDAGKTHPTTIVGDTWNWDRDKCMHNCRNRGECLFGHCYCKEGFYGIDCSNITCPGDFCYYDEFTHQQVCKHCCHASYHHTHNGYDDYPHSERKVACDHDHPGESHGICDGFGQCQCRPPFVGEDCSIRDCPDKCNGNGYCSLEYPVGRCVCNPGYGGPSCGEKLCPNDCSHPNGECVDGVCQCGKILNPYNRTVVWAHYEGPDCSYVLPYAAANSSAVSIAAMLTVVAAGALVVMRRVEEEEDQEAGVEAGRMGEEDRID